MRARFTPFVVLATGVGFLIALLAIVFIAIEAPIQSYDPYWILSLGRDYLTGQSTRVDLHSFTFDSQPLAGNYHLLGALLYFLTQQFDLLTAAGIVRLSTLVLLLLSAVTIIKRNSYLPLSFAGLCLIILGLNYRLFLRPEIIDYVLVGFSFATIARYQKHYDWRAFSLVAIIMLAWIQLHAAIIGYVLFFGLYVQVFYLTLLQRRYRYIALFLFPSGIALLALGIMSPDGNHPVMAALAFSKQWSLLIAEHQPFQTRFDTFSQIYFVWPLVLFACLLSVLNKEFGLAVMVGVMAFASLERVRMLAFLAITLGFCLLILSAKAQTSAKTLKTMRHQTAYLAPFTVLITALAAYATVSKAMVTPRLESSLPREETTYLAGVGSGGNILNAMHYGGWLIYQLSPNYKVHIDGRTNILYPLALLARSVSIASGNATALKNELEKYSVDYLLFDNSKRLYETVTLTTHFAPEFISATSTLYSTAPQPLAVGALLLNFPMCWHPRMRAQIRNERQVASNRYPSDHHFLTFLDLLDDDVLELESRLSDDAMPYLTNSEWRAIAYKALVKQHYTLAALVFRQLPQSVALDIITAAFANYKADNIATAHDLLVLLGSGYWEQILASKKERLTDSQKRLVVQLADQLAAQASNYPKDPIDVGGNALVERGIEQFRTETQAMPNDSPFIYRKHCYALVSALNIFDADVVADMTFDNVMM